MSFTLDGIHAQQSYCIFSRARNRSIAYEVIVNQRRQIVSVSDGHPGARNDKHIYGLDDSLIALTYNDWLSRKEWRSYDRDRNGNRKQLVNIGYYLICDGEYLRWPTLICPIKISKRFLQLSRLIEGARKDVEDVFGILKKKFLLSQVLVYYHGTISD